MIDESLGVGDKTPVDLAAVQADDALLDLLGDVAACDVSDAELARVLVAWRREVDLEPIGELLDTDTALAAIAAARRPRRRRHPVLGPVAAAVAVLVIAFSGVGLAAASAQPGDRLWPLTQVLYADHVRSLEAAIAVRAELADAQTALTALTALTRGDTARARHSLARARAQLPLIADEHGRVELTARYHELEQLLTTTTRR